MRFWTTDTYFGIDWFTGPREVLDARKARAIFVVGLLGVLRRDGFAIAPDADVDACIRSCYWIGKRGELEVLAEHHPAQSRIVFFQNVYKVSNPHGGRYDFDKYARMPYLMQKRVDMLHARMGRTATAKGFVDSTERRFTDAHREVQRRCAKEVRFHDNATASYNCIDADGVPLRDGMMRHFYDYHGRLRRGRVQHNINNMWWVIASPTEFHNIASFHFFSDPAGKPLRKTNQRASIAKALAKAVQEERFLRAEAIKNAMRRHLARAGVPGAAAPAVQTEKAKVGT